MKRRQLREISARLAVVTFLLCMRSTRSQLLGTFDLVEEFELPTRPSQQVDFGVSVALCSENLALVGAKGEQDARGAAYILSKESGSWESVFRLTDDPAFEAVDDGFGSFVSCVSDGSGGFVGAVGASHVSWNDDNFFGTADTTKVPGTVKVLNILGNGSATVTDTIRNYTGFDPSAFGISAELTVTSDGKMFLFIGTAATNTGSVQVYERIGGSFVQVTGITSPGTTGFGYRVAAQRNTMIVAGIKTLQLPFSSSSPVEDPGPARTYRYSELDQTWSESPSANLSALTHVRAVAVFDDGVQEPEIAVNQVFQKGSSIGPPSSATTTFRLSGSEWIQNFRVLYPAQVQVISVALCKDFLLVGDGAEFFSSFDDGRVFVYERLPDQGFGLNEVMTNTISGTTTGHGNDYQFGTSLSIAPSNDVFIVGTPDTEEIEIEVRTSPFSTVFKRFYKGRVSFAQFVPTAQPTVSPSSSPTATPSSSPTTAPSSSPTNSPTFTPTTPNPTRAPSNSPTTSPTKGPSVSPSTSPTTTSPTNAPTQHPTDSPTIGPTSDPTTLTPSNFPSPVPTLAPKTDPPEPEPVPLGLAISIPLVAAAVAGSLAFVYARRKSSGAEHIVTKARVSL